MSKLTLIDTATGQDTPALPEFSKHFFERKKKTKETYYFGEGFPI